MLRMDKMHSDVTVCIIKSLNREIDFGFAF